MENVCVNYLMGDFEIVENIGNGQYLCTDLLGDVEHITVKHGYSEHLQQKYTEFYNERGTNIGIVHYG